ncbi:MAG: adenine deaminase [Clostridiales bacterium GWB2_37_7]|nr:MAG: adenine deaminase [Clostridiales bacterium GWB2_37_7]
MSMIDVAMGKVKAQLVFKNINVVNVFTEEIYKADVAIHDGYIAGIGEYSGAVELDMEGKYICPGFIDGHVHIESSMVTPAEFARAVIPRGTTTVVADPHEIANVKGIAGIKYIIEGSENIPLDVFIMLPSCVPATPFENSGSVLKAEDLLELINHPKVLGLGELMDFPSVITCEKNIINKIVLAKNAHKMMDGHAPGISGKELNAYILPGVRTEHECSTAEEAAERLRLGMFIMLREGSAARNVINLLPAVNAATLSRCLFCTDDRHPEDILNHGHIDNNIRIAVQNGFNPIKAIQMATINAARCYNLPNIGAVAPGYKANVVILNDLENIDIFQVYKKGRLIAENGKALFDLRSINDSRMRNSVNIKRLERDSFEMENINGLANVIGLMPHSLVTSRLKLNVVCKDGAYIDEYGIKLLKIAVVERHHQTGHIGLGLVKGMGLQNGAIASTIAHDSHNIVVIGDNDDDMLCAVNHLQSIGGGICIASHGEVLHSLALPIAGLMSDLSLEEVHIKLKQMLTTAYSMGVSKEYDPFMTLAFLALPVIPELKITDLGLFDTVQYRFCSLKAEQ